MVDEALAARCNAALNRHLDPELFKALCDPRRLALVARIAVAGPSMTVNEAANCCGVHLSGVSRHLSILKRAGVLSSEKRGREVSYRLNFQHIIGTLRGIADALEDCCPDGECPPRSQETDNE